MSADIVTRLEQLAPYQPRLSMRRELYEIAAALRAELAVKDGAVVVPEGWQLAPVEPTPEMIAAFWRQKNTGTQELGSWGDETSDYDAYRAMLAAAPRSSLVSAPSVKVRCEHCDGTGDVHGIDGEWRGSCSCSAPSVKDGALSDALRENATVSAYAAVLSLRQSANLDFLVIGFEGSKSETLRGRLLDALNFVRSALK